jgi:hypothetical protein
MSSRTSGPALSVAAGALAVVCCAGLPAIATLIGGITIAWVLGIAIGILALTAALGGIALVGRAYHRRNTCRPPGPEPRT